MSNVWSIRIAWLAIVLLAVPLPARPEESAKLQAAKTVVDRELPARCERGALIRALRGAKPGSPEWLEIKRKLDVNIAKTDADRIAHGTQSIAEGLDAQETKALEAYYYEVEKRCPKE
jgi:hypothetical protein